MSTLYSKASQRFKYTACKLANSFTKLAKLKNHLHLKISRSWWQTVNAATCISLFFFTPILDRTNSSLWKKEEFKMLVQWRVSPATLTFRPHDDWGCCPLHYRMLSFPASIPLDARSILLQQVKTTNRCLPTLPLSEGTTAPGWRPLRWGYLVYKRKTVCLFV